jgi:hypothetical protein
VEVTAKRSSLLDAVADINRWDMLQRGNGGPDGGSGGAQGSSSSTGGKGHISAMQISYI